MPPISSNRLVCLDIFRGFTLAAMLIVNNPGSWETVYSPLKHAEWHGWTITDWIFPFFLWISGVSIPLSLSSIVKNQPPNTTRVMTSKILKRTTILFLLGLFLNTFPLFEWEILRIPGVLQRIALCYGLAAMLYLKIRFSYLRATVISAFILLFYWVLLTWIPVPGGQAGIFEKEGNWAQYLDNALLHGHLWKVSKVWDPEGLLSSLTAFVTTWLGVIIGQQINQKQHSLNPKRWLKFLLISGCALILSGHLWGHIFPINKSLWTSSFVLFTTGWCHLFLALFFVISKLQWMNKLLYPLQILGLNALGIYVLSSLWAKTTIFIKWQNNEGQEVTLKQWMYEIFWASWINNPYLSSFAYAACFLFMWCLIGWIFYRNKIFIKI